MMEEDTKPEILTDEELFLAKNDWLRERYPEISAMEFYREVFPSGSFEREGHPEDSKENGILTIIRGEKAVNRLVFDDLDEISKAQGEEFVVMSPVSYCGRNRTAKNARWLYGFAIDLDGVGLQQINDLFHQMKTGILLQCTYCINSGHGLHIYYLLEEPIALYPNVQEKLRQFKYAITGLLWNPFTSTYKERSEVQYQGIFQGFRMVGTQTKLGKDFIVTAFETGKKTSIEELNQYIFEKEKNALKKDDFKYKSELKLSEAKEKYPDWYERRIIKKERKERWHVNKGLYDWWLKKLKEDDCVVVGHRYWCLAVLASYAIKCDVPEEELRADAMELLPRFDAMSDDAHNRFTKRDVEDALNFYQESYTTYTRAEAEKVSGIAIPPNKRNGRSQKEHLRRARAVQAVDYPNGEWRGKQSKADVVRNWRAEYPEGKPKQCIEETGLNKNTVYKWWNGETEE